MRAKKIVVIQRIALELAYLTVAASKAAHQYFSYESGLPVAFSNQEEENTNKSIDNYKFGEQLICSLTLFSL